MGANKIPQDKMTKNIYMLAKMEANMASREDKMREIFGIDIHTATPRQINNADSCMCRWRKHPLFDQTWKEEQRRWDYEDYVMARKVFRQGMQGEDGWLAMNSAVNAINNANKRLFHDDDTTVTVKMEGMVDLGSPEQDEQG